MRDFQKPGRSAVYACNGMAATSHPLASQVAVRALEEGGNAVDAAVAAALVLGLCEPQMAGIGGDVFALVKPAGEERILGLNGSGRAPRGLDAAALRDRGWTAMPEREPEAVTIPGAVDAFVRLVEDWGRLGLPRALGPAIRLAEEGVPVAPRVAADWLGAAGLLQGDARRIFLPGGVAPHAGDVFRAPGMGQALRAIARDGRAGFYEGPVAEDMVASLRALGGPHTLEDFASHRSDPAEPIAGPYRGAEIVELPPNGQGAAALLMAAILERFDLGRLDPLGPERVHLEAEAAKLAYDARDRFIGDPPRRLGHMLAEETADRLAGLIDPRRVRAGPAAALEAIHRDTVCLSVVDRDRMAASLIYSTYHTFGSGLASKRYGIGFHNRGAGFNLREGHPNEAAGGKRPLHTIIPGMLRRDGRFAMAFGVMGGAYQAAGHVRLVSNLLDFGMDPQAAVDAPRSFPEAGMLQLETGYPEETAAALARLGHRVVRRAVPLGGAQAVLVDEARGVLIGISDGRKDGCALGL